MADRSVSVPMILRNLERRDERGSFFQTDLNNARTVWSKRTKFGRITHIGEGRISRVSATPIPQALPNFWSSFLFTRTPLNAFHVVTQMRRGLVFRQSANAATNRGRGPSAPQTQILEVPYSFYLCVHPLSQKYQIWCGNTRGGGACFLGSATPPIPRERSSSDPQFWGSPVFMPTPFNADSDQIRHGNTFGEVHVLGGSATPLHIAQCVARFVSDSWDSCFYKPNAKGLNQSVISIKSFFQAWSSKPDMHPRINLTQSQIFGHFANLSAIKMHIRQACLLLACEL